MKSTATKVIGVIAATGFVAWLAIGSPGNHDNDVNELPSARITPSPDGSSPGAAAMAKPFPEKPGMAPTKTAFEHPHVSVAEVREPADVAMSDWPKADAATTATLQSIRQLLSSGKPEKAIEMVEAALKRDPTNSDLLLEAASLHGQLSGDKRRAEELLKTLVERNPESKSAAAAMGDFLMTQGRATEATPHLRRAAADAEAPLQAHWRLGHNLMLTRDPAGAVASFDQAYRSAQAELESKRSQGASTLFPQQQVGNIAVDRGFALLESGRVDDAARMVREAQQALGPENERVALLQHALEQRPSR